MNHAHLALASLFAVSACQSKPSEPEPVPRAAPAPAPSPAPAPTQAQAPTPTPAAAPQPAGDPVNGKFSLADATAGMTGKGKLVADIQTDKGTLECTLFDDKAPITVANFVGLARGLRPWRTPGGEWVKRAAYDGTTFHRVIKGFMIQGGDPAGTGAGEPGYVIPDEVWEGARHDQRGLICMANRGKNTNGMQFFIMDGVAAHLDGGYTIFGKCTPDSVIEKLAEVPVMGDRAVTPPKIEKITIRRGAEKKK